MRAYSLQKLKIEEFISEEISYSSELIANMNVIKLLKGLKTEVSG
jgi:hypothetical protein